MNEQAAKIGVSDGVPYVDSIPPGAVIELARVSHNRDGRLFGMSAVRLFVVVATAAAALAQTPSDTDIRSAIERGKTTPAKRLWNEIKKNSNTGSTGPGSVIPSKKRC